MQRRNESGLGKTPATVHVLPRRDQRAFAPCILSKSTLKKSNTRTIYNQLRQNVINTKGAKDGVIKINGITIELLKLPVVAAGIEARGQSRFY